MKIAAGQFRAKCLKLMDTARRTRQEIIITKRGKPVAKLVPLPDEKPGGSFGFMAGTIEIVGDIISPLDWVWDADRDTD